MMWNAMGIVAPRTLVTWPARARSAARTWVMTTGSGSGVPQARWSCAANASDGTAPRQSRTAKAKARERMATSEGEAVNRGHGRGAGQDPGARALTTVWGANTRRYCAPDPGPGASRESVQHDAAAGLRAASLGHANEIDARLERSVQREHVRAGPIRRDVA